MLDNEPVHSDRPSPFIRGVLAKHVGDCRRAMVEERLIACACAIYKLVESNGTAAKAGVDKGWMKEDAQIRQGLCADHRDGYDPSISGICEGIVDNGRIVTTNLNR